jgi:2-oxoglutarate ferredoxin oxidoreductase subunit beta
MATALTRKDFVSDQEVRWCPGCGDYAILAQVQKIMPEFGIPRENIVFISGIGCASRFPYYMNTYGFHTIHGRAPAIATGLKVTRPELDVWVVTGDGDGLSIGGNHLIHCLRRTVDVEQKHLGDMLKRAHAHRGASYMEILQNCNIFNDGAFNELSDKQIKADHQLVLEHGKPLIFGKNKDKGIRMNGQRPEVVQLGNGITDKDLVVHDETNLALAFMLANFEPPLPTPIGVFYAVSRPTFDQAVNQQLEEAKTKQGSGDLQSLLNRGDTWVVN